MFSNKIRFTGPRTASLSQSPAKILSMSCDFQEKTMSQLFNQVKSKMMELRKLSRLSQISTRGILCSLFANSRC